MTKLERPGLSIYRDGDKLIVWTGGNHLRSARTVTHMVTDGPAEIGDRWYARGVCMVVADDHSRWMVGYGARVPEHCQFFGDCPDGHAVAWPLRDGEDWTLYA